ncbi:MAG: DNA polymerase III subunit delta [Candidatus Pacebacteria bacterium]|nr:DNA polymerase III subunit delta [Candidatus Paceibacterota bacterium]
MPEMIILLYGTDTYRLKQKLGEMVEEYKKKHRSGFNFRVFEGKEINFEDLKNEFLSISMFKEKKLFVLFNSFSNSKFKEDFINQGSVFVKSENILVFCEEEISPKDKLFNFLKDKAKTECFEPLTPEQSKRWAKKEFDLSGVKIDTPALNKLGEFVGSDLWRMKKEIDKLASYAEGKEIKEKDVEALVFPSFDSNIFATIDAIAKKEKKRAAGLIRHHLENGDSVPYLLSMISYQLRNIISVKDAKGKSAGQLEMRPFVFSQSSAQARQFSLEELKGLYQKILDLDTSIKTGRIDPEVALDLLIFDV